VTDRLLVFSHANGFPAGTYGVLFDTWRDAGWRVEAIEKFGHDPRYPVTSNWPHVRDQLIDFVERCGAPALLVGHSLGGYLSLLAACRRPALARGVVLLDSPIVAGWRAHSVQVAKATGLIKRVSPGRISQRRREHWPSREAALEHYARKTAFARWDPRVLADYIAAGIEMRGGHAALAFHRDIETRLYNTLPHHLPSVLKRHPPRAPVAFVGGTQSAELRQVGLATTRAVTRNRLSWIEGTHLFPMEKPDETAALVMRLGASFDAEARL
jgi:pimeloyl-ACP methyl ester carboxylesterase